MLRKFHLPPTKRRQLCYIIGGIIVIKLLLLALGTYPKSIIVNTLPALQRGINAASTTAKYNDPKTVNDSVIDMVNDYYPYTDFKFMFPETIPAIKYHGDLFLVVLVNSAAKGDMYRTRRAKIRETWGNVKSCEQLRATKNTKIRNLKWILVFFLGKAGPGTNDDELNMEEAKQHNDILVGNIEDNYFNNIIKLYMAQLWAFTLNAKYTLKTDDDVYVRIPSVVEFLAEKRFPSRFYGGVIQRGEREVPRDTRKKWYISKKYFAEKFWPPFHLGAFYILSTDLLQSLLNYVYKRKPFFLDDAYVGVAMRDLKVKPINITSFSVEKKMPDLLENKSSCEILNIAAFGHKLGVEQLSTLHQKFEIMCKNNITVVACQSYEP